MADIQPFKAIRYNTDSGRDLSTVVAPPYDVIDQSQYEALLARSPHNIVRIDLPHTPAKSLGPPEAYARSAQLLKDWQANKVLIREESPVLYYYQQSFTIGGQTHKRRGLLTRVRAEQLGGSILPHEQTFSGPKEDRLALTKATECNLSAVFGLYPDAENEVLQAVEPEQDQSDFFAELDGVRNDVWIIRKTEKINLAIELMRQKKIYIADGHHRYLTSLAYKAHLEQTGRKLDRQHPANFINMVLVPTGDPGLVILPTHRLVRNLPDNFVPRLRAQTAGQFEWAATGLGADRAKEFAEVVGRQQAPAVGLYEAEQDQLQVLIPKNQDMLADYEPERSAAWRSLSVSLLHRYLLEEILGKQIAPGCELQIAYLKDAAQAVADCRNRSCQAAFITQAPTMEQLSAVVEAGELMPQKSTFFYPKVPSGLAINPLY